VERGLDPAERCSIAIAGDSPSIESTSGFSICPEELPGVGRERLDVAALALRVERVEGQRGLAGARHAGDHDQAQPRQPQRQVLEIVLARPVDDDVGQAAGGLVAPVRGRGAVVARRGGGGAGAHGRATIARSARGVAGARGARDSTTPSAGRRPGRGARRASRVEPEEDADRGGDHHAHDHRPQRDVGRQRAHGLDDPRDGGPEQDAERAAGGGQHHRLEQELGEDRLARGPQRLAQADLPGALGDRDQHDVHHADPPTSSEMNEISVISATIPPVTVW
jgi:hypothetical protein